MCVQQLWGLFLPDKLKFLDGRHGAVDIILQHVQLVGQAGHRVQIDAAGDLGYLCSYVTQHLLAALNKKKKRHIF